MKIGIIAGNRYLPVLLAQNIKAQVKECQLTAICFKQETSAIISRYVDKIHWLKVGQLKDLLKLIETEKFDQLIMAGQINPLRIYQVRDWDEQMTALVDKIQDFRPHAIFASIISRLEETGAKFIDSTMYLSEFLAQKGNMNNLSLNSRLAADIDFGVNLINKFVELDVGQTMVVKAGSVVALESIEGTDATIKRAYKLAKDNCLVLKFAKLNQDLRFDVPVVGLSTLNLLKQIKAAGLVLEAGKVIILEKDKFLQKSRQFNIPVIAR